MPVHPSAVIDPRARIDPLADIGPFVVVDGPVVVGAGTRVCAHVTLTGATTIGRDNVIHSGAVIGDVPQDLSYRGEESFVRIGDRNVIREHVEIHRGSKAGSATEVGDDNFLMTHAHIAHDCRVGNRVIMATGTALGGHVQVADQVFLSGNCVVHQFVRVGRLALLRGLSRASRDVPPFCIMDGTHTVRGVNRIGLRRAGFTSDQIRALRRAFATLFRTRRNLRLALEDVCAGGCSPEVAHVVEFIRASTRGVCSGPPGRGGCEAEED